MSTPQTPKEVFLFAGAFASTVLSLISLQRALLFIHIDCFFNNNDLSYITIFTEFSLFTHPQFTFFIFMIPLKFYFKNIYIYI